MRKCESYPRNNWEYLPTEELDKILQAELRKEDPSKEVVLPILEILEEREKDYPIVKEPEVLSETETVRQKTSSRQFVRRYAWIAAVAAILCVVFMTLPPKTGAESIFDILFRWTESVLELINPNHIGKEPKLTKEFTTDNPGLRQIYDTLSDLGVTAEVVPTWLPTGFTLSEIKETKALNGITNVNAVLIGNGTTIVLAYCVREAGSVHFEKEMSGEELYEYANVEHYIVNNSDRLSIIWTNSDVECFLNTDIQKEDVFKIIKSIYLKDLI